MTDLLLQYRACGAECRDDYLRQVAHDNGLPLACVRRIQVRRVHHLLKTELSRPRGLADPEVVVLDPCCGTGAYLLEVARCIAEELIAEGDPDTVSTSPTGRSASCPRSTRP